MSNSSDKYKVTDKLFQILFIIDNKFKIQTINTVDSTSLVLGYSQNELIGQHINILIPPDLIEKHNNYLKMIPKGKNPRVLRNINIITKNREINKVLLSVSTYKGEYIVQLNYLTELEKYSLYERLLNQVEDVAWIADVNKNTLEMKQFYTSPSCINMYEYTPEEILQDTTCVFKCITPRSNKILMTEVKKSVTTNTNGRSYGNYLTPKTKVLKKQKWCWATEQINGCVRCYGTTTDVTREVESEASKFSLEISETENKKRKNFLERTCHEQRNLHMGVSGGAEVAIDYVEKLDTTIRNTQVEIRKLKEILNIISDSSEHINHLLDTTLSLQQMESEHFSYSYDFYNISKTIDSCTRQLSHTIKSSVINLNITIDRELNNILLRYDNTKIIQTVMNYLSNAYKYTEKGTIKLNIIQNDKTDEYITVIIKVEDSGIGIKKEHYVDIFKLYKQLNTAYGGSGIGLYLVKKYIEDGHKGSVGFSSEFNKGSSFWFEMYCQYQISPSSKKSSTLRQELTTFGYKDILLVEDMNSNRLLIGTMLMNLGYQYDECKDGAEALQKMSESTYGIILSDRKMPIIDGLELTRKILEKTPDQLIVGITGNSIKEQIDEWMELGIKGVITKPCSKTKLKDILEKYIHPICSPGSGL